MEKLNQLSKLNAYATKILLHMIKMAYESSQDEEVTLKLDNSKGVYMPLHLEILYTGYEGTKFQDWKIVSIAHYGELNGDLMRDPEMCFLVKNEVCIPYYFRNDYAGVEQELIDASYPDNIFIDERVIQLQKGQVSFANIWLSNIHSQQSLNI